MENEQIKALSTLRKDEEPMLQIWAMFVMLYLVALILYSLVLAAVSLYFAGQTNPSTEWSLVLLTIVSGLLGSSVSALLSAADRISHGWEFSNGDKWPPPEPEAQATNKKPQKEGQEKTKANSLPQDEDRSEQKTNGGAQAGKEKDAIKDERDMFSLRMVVWFLVRPFLGASMGFLVYVGVVGGYLIVTTGTQQPDFSSPGLAFLALLGGLFAKSLLEKLKVTFKTLIGAA